LHQTYWAPFDADWWRFKVSQGRLYRSRAELFLMHWLKLERLEEVPAHRLFVNFRSLPELAADLPGTVAKVASDRELYRRFDDDREGIECSAGGLLHRLDVLDLGVPRPVVLQLLRAVPEQLTAERASRALHALDSYFWRRALVNRRTAAYNRTMLDVLKAVQADLEHADDRVIDTLAAYEGSTVVWPTDDDLRAELPARPMYTTFTKNARLAYLLRCIENAWRAERSEGALPLGSVVQVEHLIPQSWQQNWPVPLEPTDTLSFRQADRDGVVHRIGNLTLVSPGMNTAMSNSAWGAKQGHLRQHSTALITLRYLERSHWDETEVHTRGQQLIDTMFRLWPGPSGTFVAPPPA
jgi:hypothetical protein